MVKRNRRGNDVVELLYSDDESTNRSTGPSAKKKQPEEPVPSPEVAELREKMAKLQKDFQEACRYARRFELRLEESQKRVAFLEDIIDKKPAKIVVPDEKLVEDLQKKLADTTAQLDETKKQAAGKEAQLLERVEKAECWQEMVKIEKQELQLLQIPLPPMPQPASTELDELKRKLATSKRECARLREELRHFDEERFSDGVLNYQLECRLDEFKRESAEMKLKLEKAAETRASDEAIIYDLKCKMAESESELNGRLRKASEHRANDIARIDELTRKLETCESVWKEEQVKALEERTSDTTRIAEMTNKLKVSGGESAHWKEQLQKANEARASDAARIKELTASMDALRQESEDRLTAMTASSCMIESLKKNLQTEKNQASEDKTQLENRIAELNSKHLESKWEAEGRERELKKRYDEISKKLEEAKFATSSRDKQLRERDNEMNKIRRQLAVMRYEADQAEIRFNEKKKELAESRRELARCIKELMGSSDQNTPSTPSSSAVNNILEDPEEEEVITID